MKSLPINNKESIPDNCLMIFCKSVYYLMKISVALPQLLVEEPWYEALRLFSLAIVNKNLAKSNF